MSKQGATRIELNLALAGIMVAIGCISVGSAWGQVEFLTSAGVEKISSMPSNSLLALVAVLSLVLSAYLIRLLFGKLLSALDANTRSNTDLARLLAERPCIRNPNND